MADIIHTTEIAPVGYHHTNAGNLPNEWTSLPLSSIVEEITETAGTRKIETVSISAGIGFVNQAEKFGKELSGKQYEKYTVLHRGDFSYNKGNSNLYPQGCIYRLNDRTEAAVPNVFESFRVADGNPDYYEQLFISGFLNRQLYSRINRGVRDDGLLNLRGKDFYSCEVPCPPIAEQDRIAEILVQCDKVIELKQREIEELEKLKKAYLKMLFPKKECDQPELRFPGFSGIWKRRKLGEIGSVQTCKRIFKEQTSSDGEIPFYKNGTIGLQADSYISREVFEEFKRLYPYPEPGDILISAVGSVGRTAEYTGKDEYFQDSNVVWLKTDKMAVDKKFLKASYQVIDWLIEGSTVKHLYNDNILKSVIWIPETIEEQKAVGKFVEDFDYLITLHRDELAESKKKRKALAQLLLTGIVRTKNERPSF